MTRIKNPFTVEGYIDDYYFCDRVEETRTLLQALDSGRNVTLISPRRMGKSGLIHHAFSDIKKNHADIKCYYIDLFHTHSVSEFINVFAHAIFGTLDSSVEKIYNTIVGTFKRCRPVISADAISGAPSVSLAIDPGQEQHTIGELFEYLKNSGKRIYIAFDEFQQIGEYPEKGVEALLRGFIQFTPNVNFIFAGSKKHLMQEMFTMPSRPFYQSTQTLALGPIEIDAYREFAINHFADAGKTLKPEVFDHIYETVFGHTWYVQYWLSRLFDVCTDIADQNMVNKVIETILREEDDNFYTYSKLLTETQRRTISAIAREGILTTPLSMSKLTKLGLPAPSTVRSNITALLDKEMLLEDRDKYTVYNRFYMLWLRQNPF